MIKITRIFILFFVIAGISNACYIDNEEELYPQAPDCDTTNVTYSQTVAPILQNSNCIACHNVANPNGQVILDNYDDVKAVVDDGRFWGAIDHQTGYEPMPQNAGKLSDCKLSKISKWLDDGAPNN